jgi:hypothetical protein
MANSIWSYYYYVVTPYRQPTLSNNVATLLVNAAIAAAAEEEEFNEKQQPKQRLCFCKQLNRQHLEDGTIVPVDPLAHHGTYRMYVFLPLRIRSLCNVFDAVAAVIQTPT